MDTQFVIRQIFVLMLTLGYCATTYITDDHVVKTEAKINKETLGYSPKKRHYGPYFKNDWVREIQFIINSLKTVIYKTTRVC